MDDRPLNVDGFWRRYSFDYLFFDGEHFYFLYRCARWTFGLGLRDRFLCSCLFGCRDFEFWGLTSLIFLDFLCSQQVNLARFASWDIFIPKLEQVFSHYLWFFGCWFWLFIFWMNFDFFRLINCFCYLLIWICFL